MDHLSFAEHVSVHSGEAAPASPAPLESDALVFRRRWILLKRLDATGELIEPPLVIEGNMILNGGASGILNLLGGLGGTAYGSGALLGVGDSNTAEAQSQTDLQASSNKLFKQVAAAPVQSGRKLTWEAEFGSGEAEFKWREMALKNSAGVLLNRKVNTDNPTVGWGDKSLSPGTTWTLIFELSIP